MAIVISLLFPARFCWDVGTTNATLVVAIAFAILAGYCYLLGYSIWAIATKKVEMSLNYIKEQLTSFIKSYVTAIVYISILNSLFMLLFDFNKVIIGITGPNTSISIAISISRDTLTSV